MNKACLEVNCPKQLKNVYKSYLFLLNVRRSIYSCASMKILWNMSETKFFDVSLLPMMYFMFKELKERNREIIVRLAAKDFSSAEENIILIIFNYYAEDKRSFFKPRIISDENPRETEDILLKYLKKIELENYDQVKTLLSEIFANIKMHTKNRIGYITGRYSEEDKMIIVSVANMDYSIAKRLEIKRKMIFENDLLAIEWALKKTNSTRDDEESGGLGLYLLRKYIYVLDGKVSILSGKCYLEFDRGGFNPQNENMILFTMKQDIPDEYNGTIITVSIPHELKKKEINKVEKQNIDFINIVDIVGEK